MYAKWWMQYFRFHKTQPDYCKHGKHRENGYQNFYLKASSKGKFILSTFAIIRVVFLENGYEVWMHGCNNHKQDHTKHTGPKVRVTSMEPRDKNQPTKVCTKVYSSVYLQKPEGSKQSSTVHLSDIIVMEDYSPKNNILKRTSSECSIAWQSHQD